jgi:VanZ family protein
MPGSLDWRRAARWGAFCFAVLVLAIVVAADRGELPPAIAAAYAFSWGDKVGHFLLMGVLAFLVCLALPLRPDPRPWLSILVGGIAISVLAGIEELTQTLFAARSASWADLGSSYAGIWLFCWLAWLLRRGAKGRAA